MILRTIVYKVLRINLPEGKFEKLEQFVKFCMVGALNNVIYYLVYLAFIKLGIHYTIANFIGFTVSVFNSYYWNNKYVFVSESKRVWWKTFIKTYISYAGTGIVLSSILLALWVEICGVSTIIAPIIDLAITIPINFIVNKFWAYKG